MSTLLENYKGRLAISEKLYAQKNGGEKLSSAKKLVTAQCLANTAKYINEAFENSVGTQRSDLGSYKRFCLDITTITVPNCIVNDIFMVQPMTSFTGYLTYMSFALGNGKPMSSPFVLSPMTEERAQYTSSSVVENFVGDGTKTAFVLTFGDVKEIKAVKVAGVEASYTKVEANGITTITIGTAPGEGVEVKVAYIYDNEVVPQKGALPSVVAKMDAVTLTARARRIAVEYSQFAAYQSKTDYGIDFESTIAAQASAELEYQIDGEAVFMVKGVADGTGEDTKGNTCGVQLEWVDEELDQQNKFTFSYNYCIL